MHVHIGILWEDKSIATREKHVKIETNHENTVKKLAHAGKWTSQWDAHHKKTNLVRPKFGLVSRENHNVFLTK